MAMGGLSTMYQNTIHETLGVRTLELESDRVVLEMDIGPKVHQPMGLLHGGASAVLAESAASMGAYVNCDPSKEFAVGTDLNISHLRARSEGTLRAIASPVRKGKTLHVWNIDLVDQDDVAVAVARCTLAIRPLPGASDG
ncbi:MAG TPA: hotdog fold thioesterase [Actinomycetota bacterium]|nr:hotdog fold thioesterase [Actinomycetota bacterium]